MPVFERYALMLSPFVTRFRGRGVHPTMALAMALAVLMIPGREAVAQVDPTPPQRQVRTYIPPDQLVSFSADAPFNQFIEFINPLFQRVTGKAVVDLTERTAPIGVNISGLQFLDAFELVLAQAGLTYRETDRYFLVEPAGAITQPEAGAAPGAPAAVVAARPQVTSEDREIRIDAIIFEANVDRLRELGTNWSRVLGSQQQGGQGGQGGAGGGQGGQQQGGLRFFLNTSRLFDRVDDVIIGPNRVDLAEINAFFRLLESEGVGVRGSLAVGAPGAQERVEPAAEGGTGIALHLDGVALHRIAEGVPGPDHVAPDIGVVIPRPRGVVAQPDGVHPLVGGTSPMGSSMRRPVGTPSRSPSRRSAR